MSEEKKTTTQKKTVSPYAHIEEEIQRLTDDYGEGDSAHILRCFHFLVGVLDNRNLTYSEIDPNSPTRDFPHEKEPTPTPVLGGTVVSVYEDVNGPNIILSLDTGYEVNISRDLFAYVVKEWEI